jgi:flagellar biosynthetic protein FliR
MHLSYSSEWLVAVVLITVRLMPVLSFASPFSTLNAPKAVRAAVVLALAASLAPLARVAPELARFEMGPLCVAVAGELVIGGAIAFALQSSFGAFFVTGRILDTQAGLSLAMVIDPSTKRQTPLLGTMFAFAVGSVFFAVDGHLDLLRLVAQSLEAVPVGALATAPAPELFIAQTGAMYLFGVAAAGAAMVVLFLTDVALAVLSRSLPQMNILMLSLQVKSIVLLLVLALACGMMAPVILRSMETGFGFVQKVLS